MIMVFATGMLCAQSTKRKNVRGQKLEIASPVEECKNVISDSVAMDSMVRLHSYRKPVESTVESVMISNEGSQDTIRAVTVDIDYRTPGGEQLHRRSVTFRAVVPPGETRHATTQSWDRQRLFYHLSTPPAKPSQRSAPFAVTIKLVSVEL